MQNAINLLNPEKGKKKVFYLHLLLIFFLLLTYNCKVGSLAVFVSAALKVASRSAIENSITWPPAWVLVGFCCWRAEQWVGAWGHPLVPRPLRVRGLCGPAGCVLAMSGHLGTWWVRPVRRPPVSFLARVFLGNKGKRSLWRTGKAHLCWTTQVVGGNQR